MTKKQIDALRRGDQVYWDDPDEGRDSKTFEVGSFHWISRIDGVLMVTDKGRTFDLECQASELHLFHTKFLRVTVLAPDHLSAPRIRSQVIQILNIGINDAQETIDNGDGDLKGANDAVAMTLSVEVLK